MNKKRSLISVINTSVSIIQPILVNSHKFVRRIYNYLFSATMRICTPATNMNGVVDILNINFFDANGKILYKGGAERYVFDLAKLIRSLGYQPRIIQNSNIPFELELEGIPVIGIPAKSGWNPRKLYAHYILHFEHARHTICSPLEIPCLPTRNKVIGINHGIHWDVPSNNYNLFSRSKYRKLFSALGHIDTGVCVDTNFINWVRTYDYGLAGKLKYIPNYFDNIQFLKTDKDFSDTDIVILYPRRLYAPRGFYITLEMIDAIFPRYQNVTMHFVGQADEPERKILDKYLGKYPNRIKSYEYDMAEMHKAYSDSQIVIIPTIFAEGTSLSCIEAMATNNAIISTDIGGLPNLIIDQHNGILIDPTSKSLIYAVESLINNRDQRVRLSENALRVSTSFRKDLWEKRWESILTSFLQQ